MRQGWWGHARHSMIDKLIFGIPAVAYPSLSVRNSPLFGEYETTRGV